MTTTNRPTYTLSHGDISNGWYTLRLSTGQTFMADENDFDTADEVKFWADSLAEQVSW